MWKTHRSKIHEILVNSSIWNSRLKHIQWRVDIKTDTRQGSLNEPTAILHLISEKGGSVIPVDGTSSTAPPSQGVKEVIQFELDRAAVVDVLNQINVIDKLIESYT